MTASDASMIEAGTGGARRSRTVAVWDPLVRVFHWSLAASFAAAWITAEDWDAAHETAGYAVGALVAFRVVWGLIGPRRARFGDFVYRPSAVLAFLRDSLRLKARRYIGHNPAGGAMVVALLLCLAAIVGTGLMMDSVTWWGVRWVEELHELAANLSLTLVALHLCGVALASWEHGENLVRAKITGRKRAPEADRSTPPDA